MLDKKSVSVLKALHKLSAGNAYKVVTSDEIINSLTQKSLYDFDSVKEILDFLEKQEYLNIKFYFVSNHAPIYKINVCK